MKVFLLSAGNGTRLKPITASIPKCLVPINGTPLLEWWLNLFKQHGMRDILINLHHFPEKVVRFIETIKKNNLNIRLSVEPELLGSAGTLLANRDFVEDDTSFFICYGDNLTNLNLKSMLHFHENTESLLTLGVFKTNKPHECGIVELSSDNVVVGFEEKPFKPKSNLANAGVMVASPDIINYIPNKRPVDISFDLLPRLIGKMSAYVINEFLIDIGTLDNYHLAQRVWQQNLGEQHHGR